MRTLNAVCRICTTPYYKRPTSSSQYCSWSCYKVERLRQRRDCPYCSTVFSSRNGGQKFCSKACSNKGRRGIVYSQDQLHNKALRVSTYRKRAFELYGEICAECGLGTTWNGKVLQLQVDHIDGDRYNNSDNNLRVLCPNCHTQTDTYGHKNFRKVRPKADDGSSLEKNRG